jgi:SnoaL-like domain
MDTEAAMRRWIDTWESAWPTEDADAIASLYTEGVVYSSHPFREPDTSRSYLERAFGEEELVRAWFGEPVVDGARAAVEYWAVLRTPAGAELTIAGCAFLRFDEEGRVADHRDYWDQIDGALQPSAGWGR